MSRTPSIPSLEARHAELEQEILDQTRRPIPNTEHISELKREKLRIKDEINTLGVS